MSFAKNEELNLFFEEKQKSTIVSLYQEFEKIVKQILEANKFKVSYEGKQYDFLAVQDNTFAYVEVKLYPSRSPRLDLLKTACNKLYAQKDNPNAKLLLVMPNYVTQALKDEIFKEWGITVWDIKSLVALSIDFPEIYYSLETSATKIVRGPIDEFMIVDKDFKENIIPNLKATAATKKNHAVKSKGSSLCKELNNIKPDKKEATDYENKCVEILKYLFDNNTDLALWQTQLSTDDGLNRNDLLCRIISYENNFWAELSNDFHSRYIVFEFKNYTDPIKQGQIFTTEKYLFLTALRSISIIIARVGADENAMKAAKGALKEAGKLIVVINNQDVCEMLKYKDNGDDPSIVLRQKIDDMLITINR